MSEDPIFILTHIGSGVVGGLIVLLFNHFLTKRRDLDKEQRARDEMVANERKALEAALHLTDVEREILASCVEVDGFPRGRLWVLSTDSTGRWVRAGKKDFFDQTDPELQALYLDGFRSLEGRGCFEFEGGDLYRLTGVGFERAKEETQPADPDQRR